MGWAGMVQQKGQRVSLTLHQVQFLLLGRVSGLRTSETSIVFIKNLKLQDQILPQRWLWMLGTWSRLDHNEHSYKISSSPVEGTPEDYMISGSDDRVTPREAATAACLTLTCNKCDVGIIECWSWSCLYMNWVELSCSILLYTAKQFICKMQGPK